MSTHVSDPDGSIQIGWSHISITPEKPVQLRGQLHERISTHVHDPCMATGLVIEKTSGENIVEQALMISCDLVCFDSPALVELRKRLGEKLPDLDVQKIVVCCTHTHTGPSPTTGLYRVPDASVMGPPEYLEFLLDRLVTVAIDAWNDRKPAAVSQALGHAAIGFNRRVVYKDGTAKMYGDSNTADLDIIEGPSDPGIEILFTYDQNEKLTGILASPACPAQVMENHSFICADFWGVTRDILRKHFENPKLNVFGITGASGDQSPRDLIRRGRGESRMRDLEGMRDMGRRLASGIIDAWTHAQSEKEQQPIFKHDAATLELPKRKVTTAEFEEATEKLKEICDKNEQHETDPGRDGRWARRYQNVLDRYQEQEAQPTFSAVVHYIRLGDLAIATNPFELFLDFSFRIMARSKARQTLVAQLVNGSGGYLPTERAVVAGSYSAMVYDNLVGPEGGHQLVEDAVEKLNAFWTD